MATSDPDPFKALDAEITNLESHAHRLMADIAIAREAEKPAPNSGRALVLDGLEKLARNTLAAVARFRFAEAMEAAGLTHPRQAKL